MEFLGFQISDVQPEFRFRYWERCVRACLQSGMTCDVNTEPFALCHKDPLNWLMMQADAENLRSVMPAMSYLKYNRV